MAYIYQIKNKINGKLYIGQTVNFQARKLRHLSSLRNEKHDNPHLQKAFLKYGEEAFEFSIIHEEKCNQARLNELEEYYISKYETYLNGYNCNRGGQQHNGFESKLTKEDICGFFNPDNKVKVLADIKGLLNRKEYSEEGFSYWRL